MSATKIGVHIVLLPTLYTKEALASMEIERTQTTVTNILEEQITSIPSDEKIFIEYGNHVNTLSRSENILRTDDFSNDFIQKIHLWMMQNVLDATKSVIGKYKTRNNYIVGWQKKLSMPPCIHGKKYMNNLVGYMNNRHDNISPLIKAAIVHSQFESIHPFEDGNGRVGRTLTSLYMFNHTSAFLPERSVKSRQTGVLRHKHPGRILSIQRITCSHSLYCNRKKAIFRNLRKH